MNDAVLFGPFTGEMYWEAGRFAPMLPYFKTKKYKGQDIKYIIWTREERFDLYGVFADILVPLRIEGDYKKRQPNCFRLNGLKPDEYKKMAKNFRKTYAKRFNIKEHIFPNVTKGKYLSKNQFPRRDMIFKYKPRKRNYELIEEYLPKDKPLVVLAPRFRVGFKRNWKHWPEFFDLVDNDKELMNKFNFIICGKEGEYIPDKKNRFLDMNKIQLIPGTTSLVGLLLVILENACFTFGSQSAIPNLSLLYKIEVLEFGCQKTLHTKTYNIHKTPITFIENRKYDIDPGKIFGQFKSLLKKKEK